MTNEQDDALIDRLAKAGGIAGPSNRTWWLDLVESYGEALVVELVTAKRAETRQPVSVAVVSKLVGEEAQRRQDEADDAAEDAAMGRQIERTSKESQGAVSRERESGAGKGAAAAAVVEPASVAAATEAHPSPTTEQKRQAAAKPYGLTEEDKIMATCKQLLKRVEEEISRRGMLIKDAMAEIGVASTAIYAWRKDGKFSAATQEKISAWLPESERLAAGSDLSREKAPTAKPAKASTLATDETVALVRKDVAVSPGAATFGTSHTVMLGSDAPATINSRPIVLRVADELPALSDLLTQGANAADGLRQLGANGYADVVTSLVERLRTVRAALSV